MWCWLAVRTDLGLESSVNEGAPTCVTVESKTFAMFKVAGKIYCIDNRCTHVGGPLCRGRLASFIVQCPLHGSRFDIRTGQVVGPPAQTPVRSYAVTVEGGHVWADVV